MNLSFTAESPYKKNLDEFVCECAFAQRTYIQPSQKSHDISAIASILFGDLFTKIEDFCKITEKNTFLKEQILFSHEQFEVMFKDLIEFYQESNHLSNSAAEAATKNRLERLKELSLLPEAFRLVIRTKNRKKDLEKISCRDLFILWN